MRILSLIPNVPSLKKHWVALIAICFGVTAGMRAQPEPSPSSRTAEAQSTFESLSGKEEALRNEKNWAQLEVVQRQLLEWGRKRYGDEHPAVSQFLMRLAATLRQLEKLAEAEQMTRDAVAIRIKVYSAKSWETANAQAALAATLLAEKKYAESESVLLSAYAAVNKPKPDEHETSSLKNIAGLLANLYQATDQPAKAAEWKQVRESFSPRQK